MAQVNIQYRCVAYYRGGFRRVQHVAPQKTFLKDHSPEIVNTQRRASREILEFCDVLRHLKFTWCGTTLSGPGILYAVLQNLKYIYDITPQR